MTRAFNDLQNVGPAHVLNEDQKISKSETGLKEANAIKYHIEAKIEWDALLMIFIISSPAAFLNI